MAKTEGIEDSVTEFKARRGMVPGLWSCHARKEIEMWNQEMRDVFGDHFIGHWTDGPKGIRISQIYRLGKKDSLGQFSPEERRYIQKQRRTKAKAQILKDQERAERLKKIIWIDPEVVFG